MTCPKTNTFVRYMIQEGNRQIALTVDEALVLIRGEIPTPVADKFGGLGFAIPTSQRRRSYTLLIRQHDGSFEPSRLHCRRMPAAPGLGVLLLSPPAREV